MTEKIGEKQQQSPPHNDQDNMGTANNKQRQPGYDKDAEAKALSGINPKIAQHAGNLMGLVSKQSRQVESALTQAGTLTPKQMHEMRDTNREMIATGIALANLLPNVEPPEESGAASGRPAAGSGETESTANVRTSAQK